MCIRNSRAGWVATISILVLLVILLWNFPYPLPKIGSENLFSNTKAFVPFTLDTCETASFSSCTEIGYGSFTLLATGSISASHPIFVIASVTMYNDTIVIPNSSQIEKVEIFPQYSFLCSNRACATLGINSTTGAYDQGEIVLEKISNDLGGSATFSGTATLEWFEGGNFNASVEPVTKYNGAPELSMYSGFLQISPNDSTIAFNVDAILIDLELFVAILILAEFAIKDAHFGRDHGGNCAQDEQNEAPQNYVPE